MRPKSAFSPLILIAALIPAAVFAYVSPGKPQGFVNDFANVIPSAARADLNARLQALENSTGAQVAVVTVQSLGDETIETYAVKLFQEWGIGQKGKDNGLLILVAPADRQARIEVGYGLEGDITDLQSGNIIRNVMIPAFKTGDYAGGISGAVTAVTDIITKSPDAAQYSAQPANNLDSSWLGHNFFVLIFFAIFILNLFARMLGRTKSWWLGGVIGAIIGAVVAIFTGLIPIGLIVIVILTILGLIFDYFVSKHPPGPGRPGGIWPIFFGGGRGLGGGGSGGFGGFGGGFSGGGGASGRW